MASAPWKVGRVSYFCNRFTAFFLLPFPTVLLYLFVFLRNKKVNKPKDRTAVWNQRIVKIRKYMRISPSTAFPPLWRKHKKTVLSYYSFLIKIKAPEKLILLAWLLVIFFICLSAESTNSNWRGKFNRFPATFFFLDFFRPIPFSLLSAISGTIGHHEEVIVSR